MVLRLRLLALAITSAVLLLVGCQAFSVDTATLTSARFSLYPMLHQDGKDVSMRQVIKSSVSGLSDLGLHVQADDVSSCLTGDSGTIFEALRVAFSRASINTETSKPRQINLVCTLSSGASLPDTDIEIPSRFPNFVEDAFIEEAFDLPPRIAAQVSFLPLGTETPEIVVNEILDMAKRLDVWKEQKDLFCFMLDGDGGSVFRLLQFAHDKSMALHKGQPLVMTCTLTANKRMWNVLKE